MRRRQARRFSQTLVKIVLAVVLGIVCLTSAGCVQLLRVIGAGDGGVVRGIGNSSEAPIVSIEEPSRGSSAW